jgi:hypothetical protein
VSVKVFFGTAVSVTDSPQFLSFYIFIISDLVEVGATYASYVTHFIHVIPLRPLTMVILILFRRPHHFLEPESRTYTRREDKTGGSGECPMSLLSGWVRFLLVRRYSVSFSLATPGARFPEEAFFGT